MDLRANEYFRHELTKHALILVSFVLGSVDIGEIVGP